MNILCFATIYIQSILVHPIPFNQFQYHLTLIMYNVKEHSPIFGDYLRESDSFVVVFFVFIFAYLSLSRSVYPNFRYTAWLPGFLILPVEVWESKVWVLGRLLEGRFTRKINFGPTCVKVSTVLVFMDKCFRI